MTNQEKICEQCGEVYDPAEPGATDTDCATCSGDGNPTYLDPLADNFSGEFDGGVEWEIIIGGLRNATIRNLGYTMLRVVKCQRQKPKNAKKHYTATI